MIRILHTSDWHLGRTLHDKKRYDESESFLNWLAELVEKEKTDLLLVAGDVFDSSTPGNRAQELYYGFLARIKETGCRHIVITGGNHDSPTLLDAPRNLLGALHIKVVGAVTGTTGDEIYPVRDESGNLEAIVCAVPFLRDRDIRTVEPGERPDDKTRKLREGIARHYREVYEEAIKLQNGDKKVPVIGMGHLFTSDAVTTEGDGVRELYIGSAVHVEEKDISGGFDYMALGHLHMAQAAGTNEKARYSGSPFPMGFGEAGQKKKVVIVRFEGDSPAISEHDIPCFRELMKITGNLDEIIARIEELKDDGSDAWLEIEVTSRTDASVITSHLDELLKGSQLEVLRTRNSSIVRALSPVSGNETLETLDDREVFRRCLEAFEVKAEEHEELLKTYDDAIRSMQTNDINAE